MIDITGMIAGMTNIHVKNFDSGRQPEGQTWDTTQLQEDFEVIGFSAPYVLVKRRSSGVKGALEFTHNPRVYWNFQVI